MQHFYKLLLTLPFFLSGCGENTTSPIQPDVKSIQLDKNVTEVYSTNSTIQLTATVTYEDGTTANATNGITWYYQNINDYSIVNMLGGVVEAAANGGDVNISIGYQNDLFTDWQSLHVNKLTAIRYYPATDINETGKEYNITIRGDFDNNETNKSLQSHISWLCDNKCNIVNFDSNQSILTLNITDFNLTLTPVMFDSNLSDNNYTYNITRP